MSAMEEQWEFFVSSAKIKAESHTRASRFWGKVDTFFGLSLIFLSGNSIFILLCSVLIIACNVFFKSVDDSYTSVHQQ